MPRLPEEILNRMLADVLDIPDSEFYGDPNLRLNPGARWQRSFNKNYPRDEARRPPALLLVCQAWRRIGTPHLYHSIFIRREGQATALANTLTNLRPDLGAYIRRLRPCAGRGLVMLEILTATTQLRVLNLVLVAPSDNDIQGLAGGLALSHINPAELRFLCDQRYEVSMREALINVLARVLPNWTNLKAAHISWSLPFWGMPGEEFAGLIRKLAMAPSLAAVQLPYELQTVRMIPTLETLARNPSLRSIDMSRPRDHYCSFDRAIFRNPLLDPLCKYCARGATVPDYPSAESIEIQRLVERVQQQEAEFTAVSTRISSTPSKNSMLQQHFEVQKKVWSRVLEFATPEFRSVRPVGVINLMMWLLLPALYSIATADSGIKTYRLSCTLLLNPALGQYVQELRLANHLANNLFVPLGSVLRASPHLRRLAATGWHLPFLATYAPVLESVSVVKILKTAPKVVAAVLADTPTMASYLHQSALESKTEDLSVPLGLLRPFRALRSLHLIVTIALEFRGATVRSDVFPVLESLRLEDCHPSVLRLFGLFDLPRLRLVGLLGASHRASESSLILWRHGSKIEELELEYFPTGAIFGFCGDLKVLEIKQQMPHPDESAADWQSGTLETLVCNGINANAAIVKRWGEVFASIDSQRLPRLKVIRGWMSRPTEV
ncbi:hypothetical protein EV121DRAFT_283030 [Schizophyllum commune]